MGAKVTTNHGGREVWKYGDAGDRYPIQRGEIWEIGPHALACGDNERGASEEFLARYGAPAYVYSDPPWNQGNVNSFRTKAAEDKASMSFATFLDTIMKAMGSARLAFIEMGIKELPDLVAAAQRTCGWVMHKDWVVKYYGDRPCALALFGPPSVNIQLVGDPTGMDDAKTPGWVMEQSFTQKGDTWFDPCMGQGCTAEHAVRLGMVVRGVEMHPRRLACTIEKIVKATGLTPVKVGDLQCMK